MFVTWSIEPEGLPTRSRSWLTSSGVASHRTAPSCEEPDRPTRLRGPKVRWSFARPGPASGTEVPRSQNRPMFCGPSWVNPLASRFAHNDPQGTAGAASRLRRTLFRRLFPAGPEKNRSSPHCLPAEIGPLVTCRTRLPLPALGEAGTAVPITHAPCTSRPSRKSEKFGLKPVDNGDIGNNRWNLLATAARRPDSDSAAGR